MTQAKHNSDTSNFEPFHLQIDQEFIEENKKIDLVRHRQNDKHKFAPFTRSQRRKRRMEVYRLHFEKGIPAIRIADMTNVDRNTINNDLKILYNKALNDYNPNEITLDEILQNS
jgi:polynucleotide 5'-kinase involved in rRNA processing